MTRVVLTLLAVVLAPVSAQSLYAPPEGGFAETPGPADYGLGAIGTGAGHIPGFMHSAIAPLTWIWGDWLTRQDGRYCRYSPTCSNYGFQAVSKHGPARGVTLAFGRLLRCHNHIPPARYPVLVYDYGAVAGALGLTRFEAGAAWEPLNPTLFAREARGHLLDPVP